MHATCLVVLGQLQGCELFQRLKMVDNDRHVACDVGLLCLMAAYQLLLMFHPGRRIRTAFLSHTLTASLISFPPRP